MLHIHMKICELQELGSIVSTGSGEVLVAAISLVHGWITGWVYGVQARAQSHRD